MTIPHPVHIAPPWIGVAVALLGLGGSSACATGAVARQTDIMQATGAMSASAAELRARVNDLADRLAARIEETSDRIRASATDRDVKIRALAFKVDAIPAVYSAAYRADPMAAAIDLWGLTFQLVQWTGDGAGRNVLGPQQPMAQAAARALVADVDATIRKVATGPDAFTRGRTRVEGWAREHPIETIISSRASAATVLAELRAEDRDAFGSVGVVSVTVENVSERLNTYLAQLPKQARWQAELLLAGMTGEHDLEATLDDVRTISVAAHRVDGFLETLPDRLDKVSASVVETAAAERRAAIAWIDSARATALQLVRAERLALLQAIDETRVAAVDGMRQELTRTLQAVHDERIAAMHDVDGTATRAVGTAMTGMHDLIDYTLLRVAVMLVVLMVCLMLVGVVAYRLTAGRGPHRQAA